MPAPPPPPAGRPWPLLVPLTAVAGLWLWPLLAGRLWAGGDGLIELFPQRRLVGWTLGQGEFPFWNPHIFGGMPLFAAIQPGVLCPLNWPGLLLPPAPGEALTMGLAYATLAGGMLAFTRALGLPPVAGAIAALAFPLGGFITSYVGSVGMLQAAGLTAWLLWALERHAGGGRRRHLAAAAALAACTIFAGHPQTAAYGLLLAGAYALVRGGGWRVAAERLAALALGGAMALVQLLPTLDLIHDSPRHAIDYAWLTVSSVAPVALPALWAQACFGVGSPSALLGVPSWASTDWRCALEGYVGPVAWLLALTALGRWREPLVRFWAAIAAAGLLLSLGRHTPLYRLWALLPFVNQMPYASRHGFEETFALAVLAAYGAAWLATDPTPARRALARAGAFVGLALAGLWAAVTAFGPGFAARTQPYMDAVPGALPGFSLAHALAPWQPAFWLPLLLVGLAWLAGRSRPGWLPLVLAVDLVLFWVHQGPFPQLPRDPGDLAARPAIDWRAGRSLALSERRYPFAPGEDELALLRRYHYPDLTLLVGEPTVNGYDAFIPARYGKLLGMDSFGHAGERDATIWDPPHHALDLLGLATLRLEPAIAASPAWQARLASGRWQRRPDEGGLVVLANRTALPHAWRVSAARQADADAAVTGRAPFQPALEAILEPPMAAAFAPGPAEVTSPTPNRMALETDGPGPGLVVIGSGYDAGWRAWDAAGRALPVYRADAILTAVAVPAGKQHVVLAYEPPRWRLGLGLSLGALALLVAWLARPRRGMRV